MDKLIPSYSHYDYTHGEKEYIKRDQTCYSNLIPLSFTELTVYHPFSEVINRNYTNWLVNSYQYGNVFVTKDTSRGLKHGWKINCKMPKGLIFGAIIALRAQFETQDFSKEWGAWVKAGLTEAEAFLAANSISATSNFANRCTNMHLPLPNMHKTLIKSFINNQPKNGVNTRLAGVFDTWGGYLEYNEPFVKVDELSLEQGETDLNIFRPVKNKNLFTQNNVNIVATQLKKDWFNEDFY